MAVFKQIIKDELYVWMNGELLYKRWLNKNYKNSYGMVFNPKNSGWGNFTAKDVESFRSLRDSSLNQNTVHSG